MLQFEWPWVFAVLPLPWLIWRWAPMTTQIRGAALRVPSLEDFHILVEDVAASRAFRPRLIAYTVAWVLLVASAARPQWLGDAIEIPVNGRDLMIAVDLSESMRESDFVMNSRPVDRLTATKVVAQQFIERRVGDRVGLILFGQQAYLHVPLTFDRSTVQQLLDEAVIGMAGRQTAIGDALGLAVKRLREQETPDKILVLMTDGRNTAGAIDPLRAAELAAEAGLTVHTIGIGADESIQRGFFGMVRINTAQDLDEKTLKTIASTTGGQYFRAHDTRAFEQIYTELDTLEPIEHGGEHFRPTAPLFFWPLATAVCIALGTLFFPSRRAEEVPA